MSVVSELRAALEAPTEWDLLRAGLLQNMCDDVDFGLGTVRGFP